MFGNIIIAISAGQPVQDAVTLARQLAGAEGQLTLAHVCPDDAGPRRADSTVRRRERVGRGDALLHEARLATGIESVVAIRGPDVAAGLHSVARRRQADLIVVSRSRRGGISRALGRDVTARLITDAPCPVAVAPTGYAASGREIQVIGAAYGDWESIRPLLIAARRLADVHQGRLALFRSLTMVPAIAHLDPGTVWEHTAHQSWDAALERLVLCGDAPLAVGIGDPTADLTRFSASVDLLVVGSRSPRRLARLIHPNASVALTRAARCPLVVVGAEHAVLGDGRSDGDWRAAAA